MRRAVVLEALVWWAVMLGLWCAFVGTISSSEIVAGTAAGLVCGLTVVQLRVIDWPAFRPALRWLAWFPTLLVSAVADTVGVFVGLWRWVVLRDRDIARFRTIPFGPPGSDARARAHRAFATVTLSATPGAYVVQTYAEHGEARVHEFGVRGPDLEEEVGRP